MNILRMSRSKVTFLPILVLSGTLAFGCGGAARAGSSNGSSSAPATVASAPALPNTPAPFATPPVLAGTPDIATLAAKVRPAVVSITTMHATKEIRFEEGDDPFGGMFGPFPGRIPKIPGHEGPQRQTGMGSGFIVDSKGIVVTNAHVVEGADRVKVHLADEREFDAKVRGRDRRLDIAVLELEGAKDLPVTSMGSSEGLRVGEYVVAVGNPFGLGHTVTMGIVSAKGRTIGAGPYDDFIQTDASINPGNSGGPLFNLNGQVVGINTAINPNGKGIGFAIPADAVKDVLPQLLSKGTVSRGKIGAVIQPVDGALARALGLDHPTGALVGDVQPDSPAAKNGIKSGDVITHVDGTEVKHAHDLPRMIARHEPGSKVALTVLRNKDKRVMDVQLAELREAEGNDDDAPAARPKATENAPSLGIELGDAQGGGAVVRRMREGGAAVETLRPGDVVLEINRKPVANSAEAAKAIGSAPKGPMLLKIRRANQTRYVAVEK
jgi:serine protease Do